MDFVGLDQFGRKATKGRIGGENLEQCGPVQFNEDLRWDFGTNKLRRLQHGVLSSEPEAPGPRPPEGLKTEINE